MIWKLRRISLKFDWDRDKHEGRERYRTGNSHLCNDIFISSFPSRTWE